jgi:hypothetical protein
MACDYNPFYIDKRVFVTGRNSILNLHNFKEVGLLPKGGDVDEVLVKCSSKDYHARWTDINSLITTSLTFQNALTATGNIITWEGPLTKVTLIDGVSTYPVTFVDLTQFNVGSDSIDLLGIDTTLIGTNSLNVQTPDHTNADREFGLLQQLNTVTGESEFTPYGFPTTAGTEDQILVMNAAGDLEFQDNLVEVANTLFVMKNGDDATAQRERFDLPFLTIDAAVTAAQTGDLIIVYPGQYIEDGANVIKVGISVELKAGADVIINNATVNTFVMGGNDVSFTGKGSLTLNAPSPIIIKVDSFGTSNLTIDINNLTLNAVNLIMNEFANLNMKVNELSATNCSAIWIDTSIVRMNADIKIGHLIQSLPGNVANAIRVDNLTVFQNSINIEVDKLSYDTPWETASPISSIGNELDTVINININSFRMTNPGDINKASTPIVRSGHCDAKKNINISDIRTTGLLYKPYVLNSISSEKGQMSFEGSIIPNVHGAWPDNIIDMMKDLQELTFNIKLYDETTQEGPAANFGVLIDIKSTDGNQKVKGYINTIRTTPTNNPLAVIGYGGTNISPVLNSATIDHLTIVSGTGFPSVRRTSNNAGLSAPGVGIPNKNSYANQAVDPVNSGPVFLIDASLTIDSAVK